MPEFLLEVFSEEIPARMQARAGDDLSRLVESGLQAGGLDWTTSTACSTPRRLIVHVDGIPPTQPDAHEERRGPREDAPANAIDGFLRSTGKTLEECELRETPKGRVWFASIHHPGRPTETVLVEIIRHALTNMPWPKSMRWGESRFRWVRPLHHVLALFDGRPLVGGFEPEPHIRFAFSAIARGHRFLAPAAFPVRSFQEYREGLRKAFVIVDREERKQKILHEAAGLTAAEDLALMPDPDLLEEVVGLTGWPVVHMGRIDDEFMELPREVLATSMRTHQKYFAVLRRDGSVAPRFVMVANTVTRDGGAAVVAGNERVLRARLSDAKFFWDQDRRTRLEHRVTALADIVFHARLGYVDQKVDRLEALAADLSQSVAGADPMQARTAARLAKADLTTGMVGEFPELQGVMGRYYALHDGEPTEVANAVAEHYSPLGPTDRCPGAPISIVVALADKLDSLAGFFAIDEKPTGSRDPYALRRAALGVIRLILENRLRLPLRSAFANALELYRHVDGIRPEPVIADLLAFFADRLKVALREKGVRHDLIDAVFALGDEDDLVRLLARVEALRAFLDSEDGTNLLTAYRRAANIVRIEARKDGVDGYGEPSAESFAAPEEHALAEALAAAARDIRPLIKADGFSEAMAKLAALRGPVDAFFDRVTVNAERPVLRRNRLALLGAMTGTMNQVADFSRIEG